MYVWLSKVVFYIMCSGRSREGAPCPAPPYFGLKKKKKSQKEGTLARQANSLPPSRSRSFLSVHKGEILVCLYSLYL